MYTCSYPDEIKEYQKFFKTDGIEFDFINKNPAVKNSGYGFYEDKPYINVLIDDKSGLNAETDWLAIKKVMEDYS